MSQANATTKDKAIAIPVIRTPGQESQFLVVRDRRFKDWIFVTGGCRRREIPNPLRTALRELEEEKDASELYLQPTGPAHPQDRK